MLVETPALDKSDCMQEFHSSIQAFTVLKYKERSRHGKALLPVPGNGKAMLDTLTLNLTHDPTL